MRKKLLAVDGNSILNRAFYGIRPLTTRTGFPTNALYGLVTMVSKQAEALHPDYLAVAFDLKAPTFRHEMYGEYKAGRRPMPEELAAQLPVAKELFAAMGYHVLELAGYEADDILGTLAAWCDDADCDAYLLTGDRDALQLIDERVHILLATNADTIDMNEERFAEKYGVRSSQFVDVKALMGDSSDNIPGVPGIGEKTALKLISEYGSLDGVYEALPTAKHTPSVRAKLEGGKESAYLSQKLATIYRAVPLSTDLEGLANTGVVQKDLLALFLRLEFAAFIKRFGLDGVSVKNEERETDAAVAVEELSAAEICTRTASSKTLAIALDGDRLCLSDGEFLIRTAETLDSDTARELLSDKRLICFDAKSLFKHPALGVLRNAELFDVMLAAYLLNSSKSNFEVDSLLADYLGVTKNADTPFVLHLCPLFERLWEELGASGQQSLLRELEMPLAAVLADMETEGFRIDREGIAAYGEGLGQLAAALEGQIFMQAGCEFNVNSPKQLGEVLFDKLGLPHAKKTKTGYSTNAEILEKLRPAHQIVDDILTYRQVTKLKSTYADGLLKVADESGRVHTTFKQTGTATGRLSSTEPNLQNIPIRTELGRELRRFFLPAEGDYVIVDADYSQIELRLLAHVSGDENMISAFQSGRDIHTSTAANVFGVTEDEVTPEMRKKAKAVNFGIMYGIGAFSLADDLGISRAQAQDYIDRYLASYPAIDRYLKQTIAEAYETGYVTTLFGRRRYIPELLGKNKMQQKFGERVAMNSPIQGTAADIIKLAMIRTHRMLEKSGLDARLILQVHDELLLVAHRSCAAEAEALLRDAMENAVSYSVPLTVDIHTGETWFEAK